MSTPTTRYTVSKHRTPYHWLTEAATGQIHSTKYPSVALAQAAATRLELGLTRFTPLSELQSTRSMLHQS